MAERLEFREKLAGILTLCESQNNITDKATVEAYFAEDNLSAEQMELVFDYLLSKKVIVKGYVKAGGSIKNAENTEEPIRYTQEEQNYLNLYEQDLKGLRDGDPLKELLPAILTMAKEMQSRKWFWFAIVFQNVFAYAVTLVVYQIGSFLLYGTFGAWTVIAFAVLLFMLFMLFRPDPYKDQKTYAKRSVQAAS